MFEGRFGLYATHNQDREYDPEILGGGLGERWETLQISFKPYPCCHFNHATMDAAKTTTPTRNCIKRSSMIRRSLD